MTRLGWFLRAGLLVAAAFPSAGAASSWGFSDASLSIRSKDAKAGDLIKHTLVFLDVVVSVLLRPIK